MTASGHGRSLELRRVGVFSAGLMQLTGLSTFLGTERIVFRPRAREIAELDAVIGWGHKPTADEARAFAERHDVPYVALEDGFLRSMGLGADEPPLSLLVDDEGIYYDARQPCRLERWLGHDGSDDPLADEALLDRARRLRQRIVEHRLSKYNHAPLEVPPSARRSDRPTVLVVDQTYGDAAVLQGFGSPRTFIRMLDAARDEHPQARILVKVHPATVAGHKRGYLTEARGPGIELLATALNPQALLAEVDHVYVCSSQLGFEALMAEKPVRCFGAPFYAGWGLTEDEHRVSRRDRRRSLDELVAAALILYPRYRHPVLDALCDAERIVDHLLLQRRMFEDNRRRYHCLGFTTWKRPFVRRYLASGLPSDPAAPKRLRFLRSARQLGSERFTDESAIVVWGQRASPPPTTTPKGEPVPIWRMEDGFLRSVQLGSQFTPPGSLVLDRRGIYYDPRQPSDLEVILERADFTDEELTRAARLRELIISERISKYNLAAERPYRSRAKEGQAVVLAIGQVQDDASVRLGSPLVRTNLALLHAARRLRPDAHLVYKPHPDVLSGNRRGDASVEEGPFDELVTDHSIAACLEAADEVHTMTSLVGFEALLRRVKVTCHGLPFYAGWGLTDDRLPLERRCRRLSLDELVAGTLLRYPRYFSWQAKCFCTAEEMVAELSRLRNAQRGASFTTPWLVRRMRDVAILSWEWLHA